MKKVRLVLMLVILAASFNLTAPKAEAACEPYGSCWCLNCERWSTCYECCRCSGNSHADCMDYCQI